MIKIQFQTSDLIPAPYAHAIELDLSENKKGLAYKFELEYIGREEISIDDIVNEGFSPEDDIQLTGNLPEAWLEELKVLIKKTEKVEKEELEESEEFWQLTIGETSFYPKNSQQWKFFLEQIHQAILEESGFEKPLEIQIIEVGDSAIKNVNFEASFANRTFTISGKNKQPWKELDYFLRDIYSGDFDYETASTKQKKSKGIYLNFGDEYWFELGKSYKNNVTKIQKWLNKTV